MCDLCKERENDIPLTCMQCGSEICLDLQEDGPLLRRGFLTKAGDIFCYRCYRCADANGRDVDDAFVDEEEESTDAMINAVQIFREQRNYRS
jgi:hypothetical protein